MIPPIGTRPWVGLIELMPAIAAGIRTEPAVSVPVAAGTMRAASAAAEPPLQAPADRGGARPPPRPARRPREVPRVADLVGGAAEGELVRVRVADEHHARR